MNAPVTQHRSPIRSVDTNSVGYLVAWQFARPGFDEGEFDVNRATVEALFAQHGFAGALDGCRADPVDALKTAAKRGKRGSHIMVEPIEMKGKDAAVVMGVYYQVPRAEELGGDEWILGARVRVEGVQLSTAHSGSAFTQSCVVRAVDIGLMLLTVEQYRACELVAQDVANRANRLMTHTQNTELSNAILEAGRSCYWAPFRKAGGVYWVPAGERAENFRRLLLALEPVGLFWPTVQPLFGDADGLTVRNLGAAAESALLGEIKDLTDELARAEGGKAMRESTVQARRLRCQQLVIQAEVYRSVLAGKVEAFGASLKVVHERFGNLIGEIGDDSAFDGF